MFYDLKTDTRYAMYESGYVRRIHAGIYQLNKTRKIKQTRSWGESTRTERILANPEEQLGIMVKSVVNWRNRF